MGKYAVLFAVLFVAAAVVLIVVFQGASSGENRPNVVVLLLDCVRADHLGCYGYGRPTSPHIDALARKGCRFSMAFSQSPWTLPSVASILTGCYPSKHGAGVPVNEDMIFDLQLSSPVKGPSASLPQMTDLFRDQGYLVYFYSSNTLVRKKIFGQSCTHFALKIKADADEVVDYGIEKVNQAVALDRPFFLYLHFMDSHQPLKQPEPYYNYFQYEDRENTEVHRNWKYEQAEEQKGSEFLAYREQKTCVYDGSIRFTDEKIGRLLLELEKTGIMDDTIVLLLSDHGESLWDHAAIEAECYYNPKETDGIGHGHTLFQELIHVPLIIAGPGIPAGALMDRPVETVDILPTLLDRVRIPKPDHLDGRSFAEALLEGRDIGRAAVFSEYPAHGALKVALVHYPFKYIFSHDEQDFLFDLEKDPGERENLHDSKDAMKKMFLKAIEERRAYYAGAPDGGSRMEFLGKEDMEQLRTLGYIK